MINFNFNTYSDTCPNNPLPTMFLYYNNTQMSYSLSVPAAGSSPVSCPPALLSAETPATELCSPNGWKKCRQREKSPEIIHLHDTIEWFSAMNNMSGDQIFSQNFFKAE